MEMGKLQNISITILSAMAQNSLQLGAKHNETPHCLPVRELYLFSHCLSALIFAGLKRYLSNLHGPGIKKSAEL
jgi:hypothetical protein